MALSKRREEEERQSQRREHDPNFRVSFANYWNGTCVYVCMFLVMDTSTDKQHYKCKILSHLNMENISVSTLVFRSSKRKGKLLFFQIEKSKKNQQNELIYCIFISKNQLIQTFIMIQSQNPDTHIHHYFLYVCVRERAERKILQIPHKHSSYWDL